MRACDLPAPFLALHGQVQFVQQATRSEFSSSCPKCGGDQHPNGEYPDRFRMFTEGKILGWCRRCGYLWFPDMAGDSRISPEELDRFRQEQKERAEARLRSAQRELELLRDSKLWERYNSMLGERERAWWRGRGIPDVWQELWEFGWDHQRNAATIPLFAPGGECVNIKLRLMDESAGRYRYHLTGQPAPLFLCDPDADMGGHVIAVEGEIKAAVTWITLDDSHTTVVGMPGLNPSPDVKRQLAQADRVTLVLDPGADKRGPDGWSPMGRLVKDIGRDRCSVLIPPCKIDDMLLAMGADKWDARWILKHARAMG